MRRVHIFQDEALLGALRLPRQKINKLFQALDQLQGYKIPSGDLSIAFLSDASLQDLHQQFLNDPSLTDVMTFPGEADCAGEICVSVDCAVRMSRELSVSFQEELTLYLVHGWLHLTGLDDQTEQDYAQMKQHEASVMHWIQKNSLLPDFRLK